ncbi:tyrosine-type recombinase/integrase [Aeromonas veronii]|uniref:tyrosine-type recombinase/integrase n=1 Tax=Aeromonas veronii TaxID=654 RepID=UPI002444D2B6|nr:tyrosine-type recombinase/integrase [Aeromonas veronii]
MAPKNPATSIRKEEFDLKTLLQGHPAAIIKGKFSFTFKDQYIDSLPFINDKNKCVELTHYSSDDEKYNEKNKPRLKLRIGNSVKTFYIVYDKNRRQKIGNWMTRTKSGHYQKVFFSVTQAKEEFKRLVSDAEKINPEKWKYQSFTLRTYLLEHYKNDRENKSNKRNSLIPVTDKTIREISSAFEPWLDLKLSEFNEDHPVIFKKYWQNKETPITSETMRKYYSLLNSLFNMCVTCTYLPKNKIDRHIFLFPRNPKRPVTTYTDPTNEVVEFIFDEDTPGGGDSKIIVATMFLCGARNSEIYRNTSNNFNINDRSIRIPEHISKNKAARIVAIESDSYWNYVAKYKTLKSLSDREGELMFPCCREAKAPHVTSSLYQKTWQAVKKEFNFPKIGRLYDARHTFAKKALESGVPIQDLSKITGHSLETLMNYYIDNNISQATREKLRSATNSNAAIKVQQETNFPPSVNSLYESYVRRCIKKNIKYELSTFVQEMKDLGDQNQLNAEQIFWLKEML